MSTHPRVCGAAASYPAEGRRVRGIRTRTIRVATDAPPEAGVHMIYGTEPVIRAQNHPLAQALTLLRIGALVPLTPAHRVESGVELVLTLAEADRIRRLCVSPFVYCFPVDRLALVIPVDRFGAYSVTAFGGPDARWAAHDHALALADQTDQVVAFRAPRVGMAARPWWD